MSPRSVSTSFSKLASRRRPCQRQLSSPRRPPPTIDLFDKYCVACHNPRLLTGNLSLDETSVDVRSIAKDAAAWEKVLHKLETGAMPPPGRPRPDAPTSRAFAAWLEGEPRRRGRRSAEPDARRPTD
jgi:hypothetical protein